MMNRREWFLVTLPFFVTWLVDRVTKHGADVFTEGVHWGPFYMILHHNHGAMLGLFSDLPEVLRIVTLATTGAFLLCTYFLIQYLLPLKSLVLRSGLSFLMGGILGNVTDRIIWGYVVDFISFNVGQKQSPVFNPADAFQWIGYGMIVYALVRQGSLFWPENDKRRVYWVNAPFQKKYTLFFVSVGLCLSLISAVFSYTYLRVTLEDILGAQSLVLNRFLLPFMITYGMICLVFCLITFAVGKIISHRIAGPIFSFEKHLRSILSDPLYDREFKLRAGDELKHLESVAAELGLQIKNLHPQTPPPQDPGSVQ
ncbi:MAG: signal peptidase II [Bdellovibrionota bacterium]